MTRKERQKQEEALKRTARTVRKTLVQSWRHSVRRAIGFVFFIVGAMIICLGIFIAGGVGGLKAAVEWLDGNKFWQGTN